MAIFAVLLDDLGIEFARGQCIGKKVVVIQGWKDTKYDPVAIRALSMDHSTTGTIKGAAWGLWIAGPLGAALGSMIGGGPKVRFEIDTLEGETLRCVASRDDFFSVRKAVERLIASRSAASTSSQRGALMSPGRGKVSDAASWLFGLFAICTGLLMLSRVADIGVWPSVAFMLAGGLILPPVVQQLRKGLPPLRPRWVPPVLATVMMLVAAGLTGSNMPPVEEGDVIAAAEGELAEPVNYWVKGDRATEHTRPEGPVSNTIYYRQKVTVYERQGEWLRTTQDRAVPRWTLASELTDTRPPERPVYSGPAGTKNDRIAADAISIPGEDGLSRADVDTLWRGANLVLAAHPECSHIDLADKSVSRPGTYYVTCDVDGVPQNIFFTQGEVEQGRLE